MPSNEEYEPLKRSCNGLIIIMIIHRIQTLIDTPSPLAEEIPENYVKVGNGNQIDEMMINYGTQKLEIYVNI